MQDQSQNPYKDAVQRLLQQRRKTKRETGGAFSDSPLGGALSFASQVAPAAGAVMGGVAGAFGGGLLGSAANGPGMLAGAGTGAALGAGLGGAAGQAVGAAGQSLLDVVDRPAEREDATADAQTQLLLQLLLSAI